MKYIYEIKLNVGGDMIKDVVILDHRLRFDRELVETWLIKHDLQLKNIYLLGYKRVREEELDVNESKNDDTSAGEGRE